MTTKSMTGFRITGKRFLIGTGLLALISYFSIISMPVDDFSDPAEIHNQLPSAIEFSLWYKSPETVLYTVEVPRFTTLKTHLPTKSEILEPRNPEFWRYAGATVRVKPSGRVIENSKLAAEHRFVKRRPFVFIIDEPGIVTILDLFQLDSEK